MTERPLRILLGGKEIRKTLAMIVAVLVIHYTSLTVLAVVGIVSSTLIYVWRLGNVRAVEGPR